jgi:hypothetical protein
VKARGEERTALLEELAKLDAKIAAAHWTFIRCARGKPPAVVCGAEFRRRNEVLKRLGGGPDVPVTVRD